MKWSVWCLLWLFWKKIYFLSVSGPHITAVHSWRTSKTLKFIIKMHDCLNFWIHFNFVFFFWWKKKLHFYSPHLSQRCTCLTYIPAYTGPHCTLTGPVTGSRRASFVKERRAEWVPMCLLWGVVLLNNRKNLERKISKKKKFLARKIS